MTQQATAGIRRRGHERGAVWQGLDYPALLAVIRLHGERACEVFAQVQTMEGAVLVVGSGLRRRSAASARDERSV